MWRYYSLGHTCFTTSNPLHPFIHLSPYCVNIILWISEGLRCPDHKNLITTHCPLTMQLESRSRIFTRSLYRVWPFQMTHLTAHCSKRVQLESTASRPTPLTVNWRLSKGYWQVVYIGLCCKYDHLGRVFWHGGLLLYTSCFNFLVCPGTPPASPATSAYNYVTKTMKDGSDRTDVAFFYVLGLQNNY